MSTQDKKRSSETVPTYDWEARSRGLDAILDQANSQPQKLFDITAVVGSVYADPNGQFNPMQVAFLQIAGYFASTNYMANTFSFPMEDGRPLTITLDLPPLKTN